MLRVKIVVAIISCAVLFGCVKAVEKPVEEFYERPETGTFGQVKTAFGDLPEQVWVYAYSTAERGFRGPADFASRVEENGYYLLDLLPGQWHLIARARPDGVTGPPMAGELWALYADNPVTLVAGDTLKIDFQLEAAAAQVLSPQGEKVATGSTGFSGQLLGPDQQPVNGAVALAYRTEDLKRMPDFRSTGVGGDGRFTLFVSTAGRYCLAARQTFRGQLRQGELYGVLGHAEAGCRDVQDGQLLDIGKIHLAPYLR